MYDRQFINLGDDKYIPLVLQGSSNCTMMSGRREILERYWAVLSFGNGIACTEAELIDSVTKTINNYKDNHSYEAEWFKYHNEWVVGDKIVSWILSGIKNAHTVEELTAVAGSLQCETVTYNNKEHIHVSKNREYLKTTEDVIKYIDNYNNYVVDSTEETKYLHMTLNTIKPIHFERRADSKAFNGSGYVCKSGKRYISAYSDTSISCGDKSNAMVFTDKADYDKLVLLGRRMNMNIIAVSMETVQKVLPYYISAHKWSGTFLVGKVSARHLFYASNVDNAKKFETEKQAQKYINSKLSNRFDGLTFTVDRI